MMKTDSLPDFKQENDIVLQYLVQFTPAAGLSDVLMKHSSQVSSSFKTLFKPLLKKLKAMFEFHVFDIAGVCIVNESLVIRRVNKTVRVIEEQTVVGVFGQEQGNIDDLLTQ